jgi:hypothetical protein
MSSRSKAKPSSCIRIKAGPMRSTFPEVTRCRLLGESFSFCERERLGIKRHSYIGRRSQKRSALETITIGMHRVLLAIALHRNFYFVIHVHTPQRHRLRLACMQLSVATQSNFRFYTPLPARSSTRFRAKLSAVSTRACGIEHLGCSLKPAVYVIDWD